MTTRKRATTKVSVESDDGNYTVRADGGEPITVTVADGVIECSEQDAPRVAAIFGGVIQPQ